MAVGNCFLRRVEIAIRIVKQSRRETNVDTKPAHWEWTNATLNLLCRNAAFCVIISWISKFSNRQYLSKIYPSASLLFHLLYFFIAWGQKKRNEFSGGRDAGRGAGRDASRDSSARLMNIGSHIQGMLDSPRTCQSTSQSIRYSPIRRTKYFLIDYNGRLDGRFFALNIVDFKRQETYFFLIISSWLFQQLYKSLIDSFRSHQSKNGQLTAYHTESVVLGQCIFIPSSWVDDNRQVGRTRLFANPYN